MDTKNTFIELKYTIKIFLIILFVLHTFGFSPKAQGVSYNQEFVISTDTSSWKRNPTGIRLTENRFIVCWESDKQDGSYSGIYGQLLSNNGFKIGEEFQINTYTSGRQALPCVSSIIDSSFIVCWSNSDYEQDPTKRGILAQLFNGDGSKKGIEFQISKQGSEPTVCELTDGNFVACFTSFDKDGDESSGIFGQLLNSEGTKIGSQFHVNTYTNDWQMEPKVCKLEDNGFVVCWKSDGPDDSGYGNFGQLFNDDGSKRGQEFKINDHYGIVEICAFSDSSFVVCYERWISGTGLEIFGQVYKNNGSKYGSEFCVNTHTKYNQSEPSISNFKEGGFIVCWNSVHTHPINGIYCQLFNSNGSKRGKEFKINSILYEKILKPCVWTSSNGGFFVCWDGYGQIGGDGIFGKYYLSEINHLLISYSLLDPPIDSIIKNISQKFKWQKASTIRINLPWELEYKIYLDYDEDFNNPRVISQIYDITCVVDSLTPGTTYFWKVLAKNIEGDSLWSSETFGFFVDWDATAIEDIKVNRPQEFKLHQNHPNPFNPNTTITFYLTRTEHVTIEIFNSLGQKVDCLIDANMPQGHHQATYTAKNISSGIYYYKMKTSNFTKIKKMLLIK